MNLTGPRGRYETLPARDTSFDDDQDELQSVLTSNQIEDTGAPSSSRSLQQRTQRNSYGDSTDDDLYFDDNHLHNDSYSDDSFSDDNEKQTTSRRHVNGRRPKVYSDPPKLSKCHRLFGYVFSAGLIVWVSFALYLGFSRLLTPEEMADMRPSFGFEDMFNSSFAPRFQSLAWMPYGEDGVYSSMNEQGDIVLTNVDGSEPKIFLPGANVTNAKGEKIPFFSFQISPDEKYVLLGADRRKNHEKLVLVNPSTLAGKVVREWNAGKEDGGWIDMQQSIRYVAPSKAVSAGGYLDIGNNNGYNHIALYTPINNPNPKWLTSGEWEVQTISAVNDNIGTVYYISTEKSGVERHLYSVSLDSGEREALSDVTQTGYYDVSFSTGTGYYLLSYRGPEVPWQKVKKADDAKFNIDLEENNDLRAVIEGTQVPTRRWSTVKLNGRDCNYMEFLPPGFKPEQKHPVLFQVYGGPNSQLVDTQFQLGFSAVVAAAQKLRYVVVVVDGRGTGVQGRDFRIQVVNQLGKYETEDQIAAGQHWKTLSYVDPERLAIWGWSYGGFMASKVTEADSGVFKAAMAVAPVTDFRFYDAVYTERYMNQPTTNHAGYDTTMVSNMTGFNNSEFLLIHGTGDDNVHVQNS
ncbi:hypothetical protein BGZ52_005385, partial [Haplosporangium bisporale]